MAEEGGKGLFTKEIEEALLDGASTLPFIPTKDMPTILPEVWFWRRAWSAKTRAMCSSADVADPGQAAPSRILARLAAPAGDREARTPRFARGALARQRRDEAAQARRRRSRCHDACARGLKRLGLESARDDIMSRRIFARRPDKGRSPSRCARTTRGRDAVARSTMPIPRSRLPRARLSRGARRLLQNADRWRMPLIDGI